MTAAHRVQVLVVDAGTAPARLLGVGLLLDSDVVLLPDLQRLRFPGPMNLEVVLNRAADDLVERIRCARFDLLTPTDATDPGALGLLRLDRPSRLLATEPDLPGPPELFTTGPAEGLGRRLREHGLLDDDAAEQLLAQLLPRTAVSPRLVSIGAEEYGRWICWISPKCRPSSLEPGSQP